MVIKNKYETVLVLSTKTLDDAALEATVEKFKTLIGDNGGVVEAVDVWGKKRLAYAINYETEGYYALISFEAEPSFPKPCGKYHGRRSQSDDNQKIKPTLINRKRE